MTRGRSSNVQQRTARMFDPREGDESPNSHSKNKAAAINLMEEIADDFVQRDSFRSKTSTTKKDLNELQRTSVMPPKTAMVQRESRPGRRPAPATSLGWVAVDEDESPAEEYSVDGAPDSQWIQSFIQRPYVLVAMAAIVVILAVLVIALCTRR